jgi:DNA polymerase-3 subunit delta'
LQRSLERGRLGHAYLFSGAELEPLSDVARTLAKTLNCEHPVTRAGAAVDCCDQCLSCRKIEHANHADVHWVRPESKLRIVTVDQMRELMREVQLKPTEAQYKVAIIVAADRLKTEAANAFLKTLEEPPPRSVLMLLTTEPQRILETIVSRCLRLSFGAGTNRRLKPEEMAWLENFSSAAAQPHKSLISRYRLMDVMLQRLSALRGSIEEMLTAKSPAQQYEDYKEIDESLKDKWEVELAAAIEAEYRRQRGELLAVLEWWLRDVWLRTLEKANGHQESDTTSLLNFPSLPGTSPVANRLGPADAMENIRVIEQLQRWLGTNVQEALALEVSLLKLRL